jgi:GGDEF domain-containing protein
MEPFLVQNREIHTTGSFGISMFPRDGNNAMDLFRSADIAMYKAKI